MTLSSDLSLKKKIDRLNKVLEGSSMDDVEYFVTHLMAMLANNTDRPTYYLENILTPLAKSIIKSKYTN